MKQQPAPGLVPIVTTLLIQQGLKVTHSRFLAIVLSIWLAVPGRVNAQHLSRYSGTSERTFRRWMHRDQPRSMWRQLHLGVIGLAQDQGVIGQEFILALDASFLRKSGKKTPGVGSFWNGCASRSERGLELSCAALIEVPRRQAFTLEARQTQAKHETADRLRQYEQQLSELLVELKTVPHSTIKAVVADGQYAKTQFMDAVQAQGHTLITKLQKNANLRYLYTGAHPQRRGPKQRYDGKVDWADLTRFDLVSQTPEERILTQEVWAPHFKRRFRVVVIQKLDHQGQVNAAAVLCSTAPTQAPLEIVALYRTRFEIEFIFRDAKQHAGLGTCQLRSTPALEAHWTTSLLVISLMRVEALRAAQPGQPLVFTLEDMKRRAYNTLYARHIFRHLGLDASFDAFLADSSGTLDFGLKAA